MKTDIDERERDTLIAALRLWEFWRQGGFTIPSHRRQDLLAIANADRDGPTARLANYEIDLLIQRLNV